jgi:hypothetical protein
VARSSGALTLAEEVDVHRFFALWFRIALVLLPSVGVMAAEPGMCLSDAEAELLDLVNQYRADNALPAVAWSRSLTEVAQWHVWDLVNNTPDAGLTCNLHSWSDQGVWSPVCYTPDHASADGMWDKPSEITGGFYWANGYEIAVEGTDDPAVALSSWQGSPPHNDVILNNGVWASLVWRAIGAGILGGHAVVWFGEIDDPRGGLVACNLWVFHDGFEDGHTMHWSQTVP